MRTLSSTPALLFPDVPFFALFLLLREFFEVCDPPPFLSSIRLALTLLGD